MDEKLSRGALVAITVLRVFVGWHFLYEGLDETDVGGLVGRGIHEAGARAVRGVLPLGRRQPQHARPREHDHDVGPDDRRACC